MSYPQTGAATAGPPTAQESVTTVLAHATGQFEEVEKRLASLRDRIESRGTPEKNPTPTQSAGVLNQALCLRNISARLIERCNELESLL